MPVLFVTLRAVWIGKFRLPSARHSVIGSMDVPRGQSEGVNMSKVRAERLVLIIDNDPVLSERLRAVLANYHFKVQLFADGNDLLSGPQLFPELIVLCIDPKRLGWALCNRIKKTAQYGSIPMIVTSAEATEKDIDEHRKLRTRADDYLLKPYSIDEMLRRVNALIGLIAAEEEEAIDETSIEELSVDDAIVEEEVVGSSEPAASPPFGDGDDDFDQETESAFAALGGPEPVTTKLSPIGSRAAADPKLPGVVAQAADRPTAIAAASDPGSDGPTRLIAIDGTAETAPPDARSLQQALDVAQKRLQDALAQSAYWHEQRDQLASERDFLFSERDRLQRERGDLQRDQAKALTERDSLVAERNQLVIERNQLAAERELLQSKVGEPSLLAEAEARWNAEREKLVRERDQLLASFDRMAKAESGRDGEQATLLAEKETLQLEQRKLATDKTLLASERERLVDDQRRLTDAEERLAAEQKRLADEQNRLTEERAELDEAKAQKGQSAALLRDREVIHLREIINKKDKDILDLRDAMDLKERQVLDSREKAREQEHKRRELEEKLL
ncbi:MAG TPA: response regulator, partial [Pseudomonadota bacterium]|nr:response regulator [Pseudomonadota bacterium]